VSDRKVLIREYKEARRPMGVFRVRNTINGKAFVGSSVDLPSILNRHLAQLRLHAHTNRALQQDWDDLGADAFVFEVVDTLSPSEDATYDPRGDLRTLEALWLERLSPYGDQGYNARPKG